LKDNGFIFVLRGGTLYAHRKKTDAPPRFHHSSFFSGECVEAAGALVVRRGALVRLYPHSGHYRPGDAALARLLAFVAAPPSPPRAAPPPPPSAPSPAAGTPRASSPPPSFCGGGGLGGVGGLGVALCTVEVRISD